MNPTIETEYVSVEVLEENLKQIENIVKNEGMVTIPFDTSMSETSEINNTLVSVGFLKGGMYLPDFQLVAHSNEEESFEFGLYWGKGEDSERLKKIFVFLQYIESEKEGKIIRRILQEEGQKPCIHTHCLFKEKLDRLSNIDKKIFEVLTSKFLETR